MCFGSGNGKVNIPVPETVLEWAFQGFKVTERSLKLLQTRVAKPDVDAPVTMIVSEDGNEEYISPGVLTIIYNRLRDLNHQGVTKWSPQQLVADESFVRAATFLCANRVYLSSATNLSFKFNILPHHCHTQQPTMDPKHVFSIIKVAQKIHNLKLDNKLFGEDAEGFLMEEDLERWLSSERATSESIFFLMFYKVLRPLRTDRLTIPEFVAAIDRFCCFTDEELLRFCFACLCKVNVEPGEAPLLSAKTLTTEFKEFEDASKHKFHTSRALLEELMKPVLGQKRYAHDLWVKRAACCNLKGDFVGACIAKDRADEQRALDLAGTRSTNDDMEPVEVHKSPEEDYLKAPARPRTFPVGNPYYVPIPLLKSHEPEDLRSYPDFKSLCLRSPMSFFDARHLQQRLRAKTLGETFWENRAREVQHWRHTHADIGIPPLSSNQHSTPVVAPASSSESSDSKNVPPNTHNGNLAEMPPHLISAAMQQSYVQLSSCHFGTELWRSISHREYLEIAREARDHGESTVPNFPLHENGAFSFAAPFKISRETAFAISGGEVWPTIICAADVLRLSLGLRARSPATAVARDQREEARSAITPNLNPLAVQRAKNIGGSSRRLANTSKRLASDSSHDNSSVGTANGGSVSGNQHNSSSGSLPRPPLTTLGGSTRLPMPNVGLKGFGSPQSKRNISSGDPDAVESVIKRSPDPSSFGASHPKGNSVAPLSAVPTTMAPVSHDPTNAPTSAHSAAGIAAGGSKVYAGRKMRNNKVTDYSVASDKKELLLAQADAEAAARHWANSR